MADTITCYNEDEKCSDCGESPVTVKHWGSLTNYEMKSFCSSCFKKKDENMQQ